MKTIRNILEGWVAKLVARQLATAALWVRIQTSLKDPKWATETKEVANTLQPAINIYSTKRIIEKLEFKCLSPLLF